MPAKTQGSMKRPAAAASIDISAPPPRRGRSAAAASIDISAPPRRHGAGGAAKDKTAVVSVYRAPVPESNAANGTMIREACRAAVAESQAQQLTEALAKAEARCQEAESRAREVEQKAAEEREKIIHNLPSMVHAIASAMAPSYAQHGQQAIRSPMTIKIEKLEDANNNSSSLHVPPSRAAAGTRASLVDTAAEGVSISQSQGASQRSTGSAPRDDSGVEGKAAKLGLSPRVGTMASLMGAISGRGRA